MHKFMVIERPIAKRAGRGQSIYDPILATATNGHAIRIEGISKLRAETIRSNVGAHARKRGLRLHTHIVSDGDNFIIWCEPWAGHGGDSDEG